MKISNSALNVLAAETYKGVGKAWIVNNARNLGAATDVVRALNESKKGHNPVTLEDFEGVKERIRRSIARMEGFADGAMAIGDENFPAYRGRVNPGERPVVLFYRGDPELLKKTNWNVAVIGLTSPDEKTEKLEREFVARLVGGGATVVSGLALGCDTVAHLQALRSGGQTLAILPAPLDQILPATNKDLADEIVKKQGLLITEYYEKATSTMELRGRYQSRDRLQALFSDCVVLAASYAKNDLGNDSGARLAMEYAKKYSIQRAVMYNPKTDGNDPKYDLNRELMATGDYIDIIDPETMDAVAGKLLRDWQRQQPRLKPASKLEPKPEAGGQLSLF